MQTRTKILVGLVGLCAIAGLCWLLAGSEAPGGDEDQTARTAGEAGSAAPAGTEAAGAPAPSAAGTADDPTPAGEAVAPEVVADEVVSSAAIEGRITDPAGDPVEAAQVTVRVEDASVAGTRSDADGSYRIEKLPAQIVEVMATHAEFVTVRRPVVLESAPAPIQVDFTLVRRPSIGGQVVDEGGAPIEGAHVQAIPGRDAEGAAYRDARPAATSASDGSFALEVAPGTTHELRASASGYLDLEASGAGVPVLAEAGDFVELTLSRGTTITGVVHGDGDEPLQAFGLLVRSVAEVRGEAHTYRPHSDDRTVSSPDGVFEEGALTDTVTEVVVTADGYAPHSTGVAPYSPGALIDLGTLRLQRGARVTGFVRDVSGNPVSGVAIDVRPDQDGGNGMGEGGDAWPETDSGEDGSFELRGVPRGAIRLRALHSQYAPFVELVTVPEQGNLEALELTLVAGTSISGCVLQSGAPLAGAGIGLLKYSSDLGWGRMDDVSTTTAEDGTYRIDGLRPGGYTVRLWMPSADGNTNRQQKWVDVPDVGEVECNFESGGYCQLSGKILRWEERVALIGEGPVKSFIMLVPAGGKERAQDLGHIASNGSFEFTAVPAGDYELQIFGVVPLPITLPEQAELYREITLPSGRISGTVSRADGETIGHLMVQATRRAEAGRPAASTMVRMEQDGTFVFPNLEAGIYHIKGDLRSDGSGSVEGIELGPGHVEEDVELIIQPPAR